MRTPKTLNDFALRIKSTINLDLSVEVSNLATVASNLRQPLLMALFTLVRLTISFTPLMQKQARKFGSSTPAPACCLRQRLTRGALYIGTYEGKVFSIDIKTGKENWMFNENEKPVFSSPVVAGGLVTFTSYDHHMTTTSTRSTSLMGRSSGNTKPTGKSSRHQRSSATWSMPAATTAICTL